MWKFCTALTLVGITALAGGCAGRLEGPVADLPEIAAPIPPPSLPKPQAWEPPPSKGGLRLWVPPHTTADGEVIEGHWVETSASPPKVEVIEPALPIPRAPKPQFKPAKQVPPKSPAPPSVGLAPYQQDQGAPQGQPSQMGTQPPPGLQLPPAWVPGLQRGQ